MFQKRALACLYQNKKSSLVSNNFNITGVNMRESKNHEFHSGQDLTSRQRAVLSSNDAVKIFKMSLPDYSPARATATAVAREYRVSEKAIRDIWTGRTWSKATNDLAPHRSQRMVRPAGRPKGRLDTKPRTRKVAVPDSSPSPPRHHKAPSTLCQAALRLDCPPLMEPPLRCAAPATLAHAAAWYGSPCAGFSPAATAWPVPWRLQYPPEASISAVGARYIRPYVHEEAAAAFPPTALHAAAAIARVGSNGYARPVGAPAAAGWGGTISPGPPAPPDWSACTAGRAVGEPGMIAGLVWLLSLGWAGGGSGLAAGGAAWGGGGAGATMLGYAPAEELGARTRRAAGSTPAGRCT